MDLRGVVCFLLAILILATEPAAAVYGGSEVDISGYPHHASIEEKTNLGNRFISSGAIVGPKVIVTTASAVNSYTYHPVSLNVRVGSSQSVSGGDLYEVADNGLHNSPSYSPRSGTYDVAVLVLRRPITWSQKVHSISLLSSMERPPYYSQSFLSSWGSYENSDYAITLRQASFTFSCRCYPYQDSNQSYNVNSPTGMLCATGGKTCRHDDGAPLVWNGRLIGLATISGFGCDNQMNESLFVDLGNWENRYFIEGFL